MFFGDVYIEISDWTAMVIGIAMVAVSVFFLVLVIKK